jgi:hypothetical protein
MRTSSAEVLLYDPARPCWPGRVKAEEGRVEQEAVVVEVVGHHKKARSVHLKVLPVHGAHCWYVLVHHPARSGGPARIAAEDGGRKAKHCGVVECRHAHVAVVGKGEIAGAIHQKVPPRLCTGGGKLLLHHPLAATWPGGVEHIDGSLPQRGALLGHGKKAHTVDHKVLHVQCTVCCKQLLHDPGARLPRAEGAIEPEDGAVRAQWCTRGVCILQTRHRKKAGPINIKVLPVLRTGGVERVHHRHGHVRLAAAPRGHQGLQHSQARAHQREACACALQLSSQ